MKKLPIEKSDWENRSYDKPKWCIYCVHSEKQLHLTGWRGHWYEAVCEHNRGHLPAGGDTLCVPACERFAPDAQWHGIRPRDED